MRVLLPRLLLRTTVCSVACLALSISYAEVPPGPPSASPGQLTTPAERADFCAQMREAPTRAKRQAVARKWHDLMIARAKEQGVEMPPGMRRYDGQHMMDHDGGMHMGMDMDMMSVTCNQEDAGAAASSPPAAAGLETARNRGIAYVTGGVGEDEAAAIRAVASRYSMRARFTTSTGEFTSDVSVRLFTPEGKLIFAAITAGPYLYAQIPPGRYRLSATLDSVERSQSIAIPTHGGIGVSLTWPAARAGAAG
uniref:Carboxypeptidase regulatory-like domain-containing protein n=1 Tax=Burkholderia sp. (strain CCGE1003) TaxID=640512 RepID=E1T8L3_BURSG